MYGFKQLKLLALNYLFKTLKTAMKPLVSTPVHSANFFKNVGTNVKWVLETLFVYLGYPLSTLKSQSYQGLMV